MKLTQNIYLTYATGYVNCISYVENFYHGLVVSLGGHDQPRERPNSTADKSLFPHPSQPYGNSVCIGVTFFKRQTFKSGYGEEGVCFF